MYSKKTRRKKSPRELTKREKELLALLVEGYSTTEISQKLNLKVCTLRSYKHIINTKLGTHNLALLTKYYLDSQETETNCLESPTPISEINIEQVSEIGVGQKEIPEHVFKEGVSYQQHLDSFRYNLLLEGLTICNYNIRLLSKKLDLPERTIYRLLIRLSIKL